MLHAVLLRITRFEADRLMKKLRSHLTHPQRCQHDVLLKKIARSNASDFGRRYDFASIKSIDDFRARVPIHQYHDIKQYVERVVNGDSSALFNPGEQILMFAMTSGTTDACKYIPVTKPFLTEYKRSSLVWGIHALSGHPDILSGKIFPIVSHFDEMRTAHNIPCGSISGLAAATQKSIARMLYLMPYWVYAIQDQTTKYYTMLRIALAEPHLSLLTTANPSTLIKFATCADEWKLDLIRDIHDGTFTHADTFAPKQIRSVPRSIRKNPARARELDRIASHEDRFYPKHFWPALSLIATWKGGSLSHYIDMLPTYFGNVPVRDLGLIASEGRMSIPYSEEGSHGFLDISSHFFEFIPEDEYDTDSTRTLLCTELEIGKKYFIILTNSAGFFRYDMNDLIEVVDFFEQTPVIRFLNKGKHISSLTGEKISEHQIIHAMNATMQALNISIHYFTVSPRWDSISGHYDIIVEDEPWTKSIDSNTFIDLFDTTLKSLNVEYDIKRQSGRLNRPCIVIVEQGEFEQLRQRQHERSKGRSEQYKHVYLNPAIDYYKNFKVVKETSNAS